MSEPAGNAPGSADVPVGTSPATVPHQADEDVGAPGITPRFYSRGYLPHRDGPTLLQSITFRLADSLPQEKLHLLEDELRSLPESMRDSARRKKIEGWLDAGMGSCLLRHAEIAPYVQGSLLHFEGIRYRMHAWCIMPNHVHTLIEPLTDLATIVQGWKSFTARWILKNRDDLGLSPSVTGPVWMREYWDRYIRDENHYHKAIDYIHRNPVSAGLCASPESWPWSSAGRTSGSISGSADVHVGPSPHAAEDVGSPGLTPGKGVPQTDTRSC